MKTLLLLSFDELFTYLWMSPRSPFFPKGCVASGELSVSYILLQFYTKLIYYLYMEFECDERENRRNKNKHGIDFETAMKLWNDKNRIEIQTPFPIENRSVLIEKIDKKLWSTIFTLRSNAIRDL